ncbi:tRNA (adenosine(37)-N6)-threonylcarbamoyltransferase complex ATPase subunit type 1 TsaE [Croceitalea sp. P059]|uniref:tRNA (adenosine(37)-N6)-threonylcarbamoyltransferase complex ATPase subunit type 1 TsaE n=1 Tax=Croceitalea sp. P059 TaxID=3075601 RepID=UPI002883A684|nr:tRNA (adenosine(37)-N6)-threonylcarbamoyltransferase complex ATPase subunit type 1 TsaE [Croceitalea sp. P059]MDT0539633.1 tRNA (adenosine(37)-N6)-threonylcarbamoyltransferase complex ATPase subunit type 1 TsaE [Croceitalea sp. P059]
MPEFQFNKEELQDIAANLISSTQKRYFCFFGEMGAGKTTLIKAILAELGVKDIGHSPTFGLVNEYEDAHGQLVAYHFDFYRIENEEEVYDFGIEEYLNQEIYTFIEWPERIPNLIPKECLNIKLHFVDENTRRIEY